MESFQITKTTNSLSVEVIGLAGKYCRVFVYENGDTSSADLGPGWVYSKALSLDVDITGLTANTKYVVSVYMATDGNGSNAEHIGAETVYTNILSWYWSTAASNAMSNIPKGPVTAVTWQEWNSLCDKVKECLERAGETWYCYYGPNGGYTPTHEAARMSSSDKTLTAARFNAVRGNIGSHVSTGILPASKGDKVMGSYFLKISEALNTWINTLNS